MACETGSKGKASEGGGREGKAGRVVGRFQVASQPAHVVSFIPVPRNIVECVAARLKCATGRNGLGLLAFWGREKVLSMLNRCGGGTTFDCTTMQVQSIFPNVLETVPNKRPVDDVCCVAVALRFVYFAGTTLTTKVLRALDQTLR